LIAWQKARELTKEIYELSKSGPFSKDYGLRDQVRRASVSIMSNIAEGFDRASRPEFHKFLVIAKGSAAEVRSQLYIAYDVGHITESQFNKIGSLAEQVNRIIAGLRKSVQKQRDVERK
jgi:four helix bundle protein